jgi:DNA-binding transcriptional ArsR family regulator
VDDLSPVFERVSSYFALLSEPMRIRILHVVCQQERTVGDIVAEVGGTQANVSRHLGHMYRAGALTRRKQGNFTYYAVADQALTEICRSVCVHIAGNLETSAERKDLMELANELGAGI